jgi:hypothetical protein
MALLAECPVCRQPLRWTYLLRTWWSRWPCDRCGSLLGVDRKRRLLSILPIVLLALPVSVYLTRSGWPDLIALPVALILWLPCFLLLERAVVLERRGVRCRQCGYDLRGQTAPRCPECGQEFDAAERAYLETGVFPSGPVRRRSRAWFAIPLLLFAVTLTGLAVGITHYRAVQARIAGRQALAAQQATQAAAQASAGQPPAAGDQAASAPAARNDSAPEPGVP